MHGVSDAYDGLIQFRTKLSTTKCSWIRSVQQRMTKDHDPPTYYNDRDNMVTELSLNQESELNMLTTQRWRVNFEAFFSWNLYS